MDKLSVSKVTDQVVSEVEKIIVGKTNQVKTIFMAILAEGHVLIEDMPGVGKTTLIKTLSKVLGCDYKRIQFTPDLLPSDIVGVNTYNQKSGEFQFISGPVVTNVLLADEINRAIPRTQSALLEAMEERQITVDGKTYALPSPFIVMATQNPIETEGTFPLPAAQMDRFMVKISMGYPSQDEESRMLVQLGDEMPFHKVNSVLDSKVVVELQHEIQEVYISEDVTKYIVDVVQSTRQHNMVRVGASPRASRVLYKAGKVWAAMKQRDYVTPDDIQEIVMSILSHRLMLTNEARLSRKTREEILSDIMSSVPVPPNRKGILYGR